MRKLAGVVLAISFCASCGGGSDTEPALGEAGSNTNAFSDPVPIKEELISLSDTSVTESAVARGLDPETTLIPDTFHCYSVDNADFQSPAMVLDLTPTSYTNAGGTGFYETDQDGLVRFSGGDLDSLQARVEFDFQGQYFTIEQETASNLQCFQGGASHARAFHRFTLNTPEIGFYECTSDLNATDIEIVEGSGYVVGSEMGHFTLSDVIDSDASTMLFDTGPLTGISTVYAENPETGEQQFDLSENPAFAALGFAANTLIECKRERDSRPFKRFSVTPAPTPPTPSVAYPADTNSGMYFNDDGVSSNRNTTQHARFFYFQRDGYMFVGIPDYQSVDCDRTLPNGLPQCHYYTTEGSTLIATSAIEDRETFTLSADEQGRLTAIDGSALEAVGSIDLEALNGVWLNTAQFDAGCFGDDACYSFTTQNGLRFDSDGRFIKDSTDTENANLAAEMGTRDSFVLSNSDHKGDYNVVANRIKLRFDNGVSDDHWIYLTNDDRLVIDNLIYTRQ